jgi:hypothetical protein
MKAEGSLACLQDPGTGRCPKPDESVPHPYITFLKILIFSLTSTPRSPKWYLPFIITYLNLYLFLLSPRCATCLDSIILFDTGVVVVVAAVAEVIPITTSLR